MDKVEKMKQEKQYEQYVKREDTPSTMSMSICLRPLSLGDSLHDWTVYLQLL